MWNFFKRRKPQIPSQDETPMVMEPDIPVKNEEPVFYRKYNAMLFDKALPKSTKLALIPTPVRWFRHLELYSDDELTGWGLTEDEHPELFGFRRAGQQVPEPRHASQPPFRSQADIRRWALTVIGIPSSFVFALFPELPKWRTWWERYEDRFTVPEHAYGFVHTQRKNATSDEVATVIAFFDLLGLGAFCRDPAEPSDLSDRIVTWLLLNAPMRRLDASWLDQTGDHSVRWPTIGALRDDIRRGVMDPALKQQAMLKLAHYGLLDDFPEPPRPEWPLGDFSPPRPPEGMFAAHAFPIIDCVFNSRLINGAIADGHWWVGDIMSMTFAQIKALPGVGTKTATEFMEQRTRPVRLRDQTLQQVATTRILERYKAGEIDDRGACDALRTLLGSE
jgi:hypothetical protein